MTEPLRILLLTSNTGYAHNAAASAIEEWSKHFYGDKVIIETEYLLENSQPIYKKLVNFYNFIQCNIPRLHYLYYQILEYQQYLQDTRPNRPFVGKKYWIDRLHAFQPDVIISTHCQTNLGYFDLAKQILVKTPVCITYSTDIDGDFGFTHNWINPNVDIFWAQTPEVASQVLKMGLNSHQVFPLGTLLNRSFYQKPLTNSEKESFLQQKLNLTPEKFTIMLATGGAGANNHLHFLESLLFLKERIQVIALCGKNVVTKTKLEEWRSQHPDFGLSILPFTDQMASLLQVSSVVVARPGARTSIESIHCGCPMIFNGLKGIMPHELIAVRYFQNRKIAHIVRWPQELSTLIQSWLEYPETYEQLKQRIVESQLNPAPEKIMTSLMTTISLKKHQQ